MNLALCLLGGAAVCFGAYRWACRHLAAYSRWP